MLTFRSAISTAAVVAIIMLIHEHVDAQPMALFERRSFGIGGYPGSYAPWSPYCYNGCYGGYGNYGYGNCGYSPWFASNNNNFNANNNALNANAVTSAFNSHQNEADHIANSDVNAYTTANNVCADNNYVNSANHNIVG
ncbi:hypothetical protein BDF19DRAFT_442227 [Syncephalis fuscata]|nr:hypothetical protein BDF19DRAFT_442216 [Syncephalis fuscata]KAI9595109.1 hypothetical protein BDF19DRAFT_442227 [Syncephalis fuscata]